MIATIRQMAARARRLWRELDHAQRRLFELQTELPDFAGVGGARRSAAGGAAPETLPALEALWALPARQPGGPRGGRRGADAADVAEMS